MKELVIQGHTKHARVRQGIVNLIARDGILPGNRLPTERQLADQFGTSVMTVRQSLSGLAQAGLVRREHGRGTFLTADLRDLPQNGVVAVLVVGRGPLKSHVSPRHQDELMRALSKRGCGMRVVSVYDKPDHESIQMLKGVTGVIATGWLSQSWMSILDGLSVPAIISGDSRADRSSLSSPPMVTYDWFGLSQMMCDHLVGRGATRLGLVTAGDGYAPSFPMQRGFCHYMDEAGMGNGSENMLFAEASKNGHDLVTFIDSHPDLDGLLVEAGFLLTVLGCLFDRPRQPLLGVLSERAPYGQWPSSISFSQFEGNVFTQSVEMLFELIGPNSHPVKDRLLPPCILSHENTEKPGLNHHIATA